MRKITLLLLALVCTVGAWAEVPALKVSTEGGTITYYTIKNYRSGKFAKWAGDAAQIEQTAELEDACYWYVLANGDDGYTLCNKATSNKYAAYNSFTAEGAKTYILENPYRAGYLCVSLTSDLSGQCWDDQGNHTKIGDYNPRETDNEGTSWVFAESTGNVDKDKLKNALDLAKASVGTNPGCYPQSAVDAAQAVFDDASGDYAAAKTALEAAFILPVSGKYYQITSAYAAFENNQGVTKSVYVDEGKLKWKSTDRSDMTSIWEIYNDGSKYVFKNYSTGTYISTLADNRYSLGDEPNATTGFTWYAGGICNVGIGGNNFHAESHGQGAGTNGFVIGYGGGNSGASAWYLVEVDPNFEAAYGALENRLNELKRGKQLGTNPGQYTMSGMDQTAYENAINAALEALNTPSTSAELTAALAALNTAVQSASFTQHDMEVGKYYRIQSTSRGTYTGVERNDAMTGTSKMWNNVLDEANPGQIWKLEQDGENYFLVNVLSGLYPQYVNGGETATTYVGSKNVDYKFTHDIFAEPTATTEPVHRIYFGGRQVNIETAGYVNWWTAENARQYIWAVDKTDDEILGLVNAWVASQNMTANAGAEKISIAENVTQVISPNEFADPAVVNNAIDALKTYTDATAPTLGQAQAVYNNYSIVDTYQENVTQYGGLISIPYVLKAKYGTICLPINYLRPENIKLYSCSTAEGGVLDLVEYTGGAPKNNPYIVEYTDDATVPTAEAPKTYQLIGYAKDAATTNQTQGLLTGVLESGGTVPAGSYILANRNDKVGFYRVAEGANFTAEVNKCYLTLPADGAARFEALFFDGTTTAIEGVQDTRAKQDGAIYNMAGQRLSKLQKGLNIVNGKVVLVK